MSVEFYVQGFEFGEPSGLPLEKVERIFGLDKNLTTDFHKTSYFAQQYGLHLDFEVENGLVTCATVARPTSDPGFLSDLFVLLQEGPYLLFASDGQQPVSANPEMSKHMPAPMIEALGKAKQISSSDEIETSLYPAARTDQ